MTSSPSSSPHNHHNPEGSPHPGGYPHRWAGLAVLMVAIAILALDTTALNFAVPALAEALHPSAAELLWIVDVYAFALAALLVTMGALGDRFGRRKILLYGTVAFGAASLAAGLVTSATALIVCRALQGMAGACLMPATLSLIRVMFTDRRERAKAVSMWVAVYSVGAALGPIIGGLLLSHFSYGSIFFINVPLCALIVAGGLKFLPTSTDLSGPAVDGRGALLSIIALFSLVYAVKVGPLQGMNLSVMATAVVFLLAGTVFVRHIHRVPNPLIDPSLLRNPVFAAVATINGVSMFLYVGVLFYLSQYFQLILGLEPLAAGILMAPGMVCSMVATLVTGRVMARVPARPLLVAALLIAACGIGIIGFDAQEAFASVGGSTLWLALGFSTLGIGVGMIDPISNNYILSAAPPERAGAASSISETGYELGGAFGTAVLGTILMAVFQNKVFATTDLTAGAASSLSDAHSAAGGDPAVLELVDAAFRAGVSASSFAAVVVCLAAVYLVLRRIPRRDPAA